MNPRALLVATACAAALLLGGCGDGTSAPPAAVSTPTATEATPRLGLTGWLDQLPVGPPPALGYVIGHRYHSPDGRVVRLPSDHGIQAIARLGDGYVAVDDRVFEGTAGVCLLDARGRRASDLHTISGAPALSLDGRTLRWITFTPPEAAPELGPTVLHVADVRTGEIRTRVLPTDPHALPRVRQRDRRPDVDEVLARFGITSWLRGRTASAAWEGRHHLLLGVLPRGGRAAVVRLDTRSGAWSLAVDLTPLEGTWHVVFETTR
ncbi:hypothetical protein F0U44_03020 [Nocardioides humilatus]|uniref:Uncharacterized protein n=1 Tax=Nocardioides humilatus TaxID=2607660 RepID=A0A5B1LNX1_9ACTN|nr:hypothetical protein [Nocardioides humilatus]KAA1421297.1 hypothetical protein F0U44_03020 [Nocardioides humilatus]